MAEQPALPPELWGRLAEQAGSAFGVALEEAQLAQLAAYLDLLFGIETQSAYGFLHPYPTMRVGADVTIGQERHGIARLKRRQGSLVDPEDRVLPDTLFSAVLGGMDSLGGALLASILLGVVEGVASSVLDPMLGGASRDLVDAALLILTIMIRPHGLFGRHDIERV